MVSTTSSKNLLLGAKYKDASGRRFVYQTTGESDKNHGIDEGAFESNGEGRIYETYCTKCPVKCFLKYISLLNPASEDLWQRPRAKVNICNKTSYCNVPLGEKYLGNMLSMLSSKYGLSQRYTNHSLRVTSLQVLDDENIDSRHIIRVSGHKNTDSVSNYARHLSVARKRKISSILSNSVGETGTNSSTPRSSENKENQPITIHSNNDDDKFMSDIPQDILLPRHETDNLINRVFAPVLNNCSNINFNVNIYKQ